MKTKILKISATYLFLAILSLLLMASGCEKDDQYTELVNGYIVGSFICDELNYETGQATGNPTERGYCILIEGSENVISDWPLDFYTFNFPDNLFTFPNEILIPNYSGNNCGPTFFPDSLKNTYKIKFKYQKLIDTEKQHFVCGICTLMEIGFPWDDYSEISLIEITKY